MSIILVSIVWCAVWGELSYAFLTNVKGGTLDSVALSKTCQSGDLALSLISSIQKLGSADWNDQACLFGKQLCYVAEDRNGVASGLFGTFTNFQLNAHRVSIFFPSYDNSAMVVDGIIELGTPCLNGGSDVACMTPLGVEKSESLNAFYFVDGQVAEIPRRAAVCMVLPNAIGKDDTNIKCINKSTGLTIIEAWGAVNESTNKFFLSIPQPGNVTVHRFSISATDIVDDSVSRTTTVVGTPPLLAKMSSLDEDGKLYFSGRNGDVYTIDQDLAIAGSAFITGAGVGVVNSIYFDDATSALYLCGSTRIEKYDTSGSLLAASSGFNCRDVQTDTLTGKVYATSNSGSVSRLNASTLAVESSLVLSGATDPVAGLEVDSASRRLYAITEFTGTDIRTFYKVKTCAN